MGVGPEDSRVRQAVTIRAAVIAAAYNFDRGGRVRLDPRNDGRVPELMVKAAQRHLHPHHRPGTRASASTIPLINILGQT